MSRELEGTGEDSVGILHVAISDVEKCRDYALVVNSCLQGQETEVQDLHGKLTGSYIKPEMQVEIYSLTIWMRVWCREEEFWQSRNLSRQEKPG